MFFGVKILYFYVTIRNETLKVMVLDSDVICTRSHLWGNRECDCSLIVLVNRYWNYWIYEKTTQHHQVVSLKSEYELNLFHKTHKR